LNERERKREREREEYSRSLTIGPIHLINGDEIQKAARISRTKINNKNRKT
jgi:hypothetical protein